jgi:hypothetical protein
MPSQSNPTVRLERFNPSKHKGLEVCCRANSNWMEKGGKIPDHPSEFVMTADFGEGNPWVAGHCSEHLAAYMGMHQGVAHAITMFLAGQILPKA